MIEEENIFETDKYRQRVPRKNTKKKKDNFVIKWAVSSILVSALIVTGIVVATPDKGKSFFNSLRGISDNVSLPFIGGRQNILIMGVDSNGGQSDPFKGTRSDTILLANIDPFSKTVNAVSIPRDSKVYIAENNGVNKINAAHAIGGPDLLIKTIQNTFGVRVDHYIAVDYSGIKELVNAVGGVPVNVEKRMHYDDYSGNLHVNLYPGKQVLNAEQAEQYIRFRHDAIGDIGRMRRQQWFVKGLVQRLQSPEIITRLPEVIEVLNKYVETDMSIYQLSKYAAYLKSIDMDQTQIATLPGKPSERGYISYWILEPEEVQQILDKLIYREESPLDAQNLKVSLLYNRGMKDRADEVKNMLETKYGYEVTCESRTKDPHSQILAHNVTVPTSVAKQLKNNIPELAKAQFIISPNNYLCSESDLSIVIADNN